MAYGMAIASNNINAEVIDAEEFPRIASQYKVGPVPKTVINDRTEFIGAAPESYVFEQILMTP